MNWFKKDKKKENDLDIESAKSELRGIIEKVIDDEGDNELLFCKKAPGLIKIIKGYDKTFTLTSELLRLHLINFAIQFGLIDKLYRLLDGKIEKWKSNYRCDIGKLPNYLMVKEETRDFQISYFLPYRTLTGGFVCEDEYGVPYFVETDMYFNQFEKELLTTYNYTFVRQSDGYFIYIRNKLK